MENEEILNKIKELETRLDLIERGARYESDTITFYNKVQFIDEVLDKGETVVIN